MFSVLFQVVALLQVGFVLLSGHTAGAALIRERHELTRTVGVEARAAKGTVDVAYLEGQVTRMQRTLTRFHGHLSTLLDTLKSALEDSGTLKPTPLKPHHPPELSPPANGAFNPDASNNIAVYYGQTPPTSERTLPDLCADPSITIINLAFVPTLFGPGGYPKTSFGPLCSAPQTPAQAANAPGLQNCAALGAQVAQCQAQGKAVLVSLGGFVADSSLPSAAAAGRLAQTLWDLFGAGSGVDPTLRPLGPDVVVDGFDIDNEDHSTAHWGEFARALRALYASPGASAGGRRFFLSATPQCPRPDASIPRAALRAADWVNVQFYNNPACELGAGAGFLESVAAWSAELAASPAATRLLLCVPAWPGAGSGYVGGPRLKQVVRSARAIAEKHGNFGGVAMWDGVEGVENTSAGGKSFVEYVAEALA